MDARIKTHLRKHHRLRLPARVAKTSRRSGNTGYRPHDMPAPASSIAVAGTKVPATAAKWSARADRMNQTTINRFDPIGPGKRHKAVLPSPPASRSDAGLLNEAFDVVTPDGNQEESRMTQITDEHTSNEHGLPVLKLGHELRRNDDSARLRPCRELHRRRSAQTCALFIKHAPLSRLRIDDDAPVNANTLPAASADERTQPRHQSGRRDNGFYLNVSRRLKNHSRPPSAAGRS